MTDVTTPGEQVPGKTRPVSAGGTVRSLARVLLIDVGAPVAVFYLLHASGVGDVPALSASAVPPLLHAVVTAVRERRVEPIAVAVLVATVLSSLLALLGGGGPRELLARGAWLTAPFGLWMLASLWARRPMTFTVTRSLLAGRAAVMDRLWARDPRFRRAWRAITLVWGLTGLADSALRIAMAATLPVAVVPALDSALSTALIVVLQPPTWFFLWRSGRWNDLFGRPAHQE
jgi:hypothetical protein